MLRTGWEVRVLALVSMVIVTTYLVQPAGTLGVVLANLLFVVVSAGAAVLSFRSARQLGTEGAPWLCFGIGYTAWSIGQLTWIWYEIILWEPVPYPSVADIGYAVIYPCMFIGLLLLIRRRVGGLPVEEVLLDSLIVVSAFALIANELIITRSIGGRALSPYELTVTLAWEVTTFGLITLAAVALFVRVDLLLRGPLGILMLGFLSFSASNLFYSSMILDGSYRSGTAVDLGWHAGFLLFGLAAIVASRTPDDGVRSLDAAGQRRASIARTALMVLSVVIVTSISAYAATTTPSSQVVTVFVIVAGALLAMRLGYAAIQADRLTRRTRERDRLAGVVAASSAISSTLDLEQLLPLLATATANAVGRERAQVSVFTNDMTQVETSAFAGFSADEEIQIASLTTSSVGRYPAERRVITNLEPTVYSIDDPGIPHDEQATLQAIGKLHTLVTPLVAHGKVVGIFDTWTPFDATPFEQADIAAAVAVGQQAGLAIHNARLLARTRQHAVEQAALLRVSQAAVSSLDLDEVLAEIARASLGVANAEACAIEIWDPERGDSFLAAESTIDLWPGTSSVGKRLSFDDWPTSLRVLQDQVTLNLMATDAALSPREQAHLQADDTRSMLLVPLVVNGASLGILNLFSRSARRFTPNEERLASDLAAQISVAIDRARLHEALRERADKDGLTGVYNHRTILELVDTELSRMQRNGTPLSVLMIDLDDFKLINDTHGHQTGDEFLRETATFLQNGIREIDSVGRYGGDEFLLVLPDTDADGARQLASRLLDLAAETGPLHEGNRYPIQISIGIATAPTDASTRPELLSVADLRMYESKAARRWISTGM